MTGKPRDGYCTPLWLAEIIGRVDMDPCSNEYSHIEYEIAFDALEDGLSMPWDEVPPDTVVYCNPPYSRGQVMRWVERYRHTRFLFLLRFDPSTQWFSELMPFVTHIWLPNRRINFEPPPGVKASSNPFPHGLFMHNPDPVLLDRLRAEGFLLIPHKGTKTK